MNYFEIKVIHYLTMKDEKCKIYKEVIYEGYEVQMVYATTCKSLWKSVQMFHHSYFPLLEDKQVLGGEDCHDHILATYG